MASSKTVKMAPAAIQTEQIEQAEVSADSATVLDVAVDAGVSTVAFSDGSEFRFHNMWLRDACRDETNVHDSHERNLATSALINSLPFTMGGAPEIIDGGATVLLTWPEDGLTQSFDAHMLRTYADMVGDPVNAVAKAVPEVEASFFDYIENGTGRHVSTLNLQKAETFQIGHFQFDELTDKNEEFIKAILDPGAIVVHGMPADPECTGDVFSDFAMQHVGGLQKHALRDNAHWTITTDTEMYESMPDLDVAARDGTGGTTGQSNAYDATSQLCNHTDQALYGAPGILLMFHVAMGQGANSLTDGFSVAYALKERYPEDFEMLTTIGMDAGRRLTCYSTGDMHFNTSHKVIQLDDDGNVIRIQFHEINRTPMVHLDFETFPKYWQALQIFYDLVHSDEFQIAITMEEGDCLVLNNWRMMHGRSAGVRERTILGGTVTRDSFYSRMRMNEIDRLEVDATGRRSAEVGIPSTYLAKIAAKL